MWTNKRHRFDILISMALIQCNNRNLVFHRNPAQFFYKKRKWNCNLNCWVWRLLAMKYICRNGRKHRVASNTLDYYCYYRLCCATTALCKPTNKKWDEEAWIYHSIPCTSASTIVARFTIFNAPLFSLFPSVCFAIRLDSTHRSEMYKCNRLAG